MELGFWIPIASGIPDSLRGVFRIPKPRIPESTSKIFPDSAITDSLTWGEKQGLAQSVSARRQGEKIEEPIVANTRQMYLGYQRFFLACGD